MKYPWLLKMAWRDSRKNKRRLFLFMSSIVLGIAALVAINSFGINMKAQINAEARELLGADLEVRSTEAISDELKSYFDSLGMQMTEEVNFASMVFFPKNEGTRLIHVRAVDSDFPFYGKIESQPLDAAKTFNKNQSTLVDQTLLMQFNADIDDSVKIGEETFYIEGSIIKVPGQSRISTAVAPPVFIPLSHLEKTGLIQIGSRINYKLYLKYPPNFDPVIFKNNIQPKLEKMDLRFDDVEERKKDLGDSYADLSGFLNLTAFIALLLGCIGVASSVHIYIKEKLMSVAILRCLGVQGKDAVKIFLVQIFFMGLIGSTLGSLLGTFIQFFLPQLFADFLPFDVEMSLSWHSILQGIVLGSIVSILFALIPLLQIRKVSPLKALRASYESPEKDYWPYLIYGLIVLFIYLFSLMQLRDWLDALFFSLSLIFAAAVLTATASLAMWMIRKFFPLKSSFIWRQGLSNLYRPNNQTRVLLISIGLGTTLITTLFLSQDLLLDKVKFSAAEENRPNMVLFDIQSGQLDSVIGLTKEHHLPIIREVPVVAMRLHTLNGVNVDLLKEDTTDNIKDWVLKREYRVTYRDSLIDSEKLLEGNLQAEVNKPDKSIFVSISQSLAEDMDAKVGDPLSFNVQGAIINCYVGSIRKIDWQRVQTNFLVVFPRGVLETAPKFHVILTRFESKEQSAAYQQAMVKTFANISIIDLNLILKTVDEVLGKLSFVIRFMAFFSIFTGILVLIGSVMISKFQRIYESVLLRTMGANRKQILRINLVEYFLLGSLASLTGILLALLTTWALAYFRFESTFTPDIWPLTLTYLSITALTIIVGLSNSREVLNKPPLEILRE